MLRPANLSRFFAGAALALALAATPVSAGQVFSFANITNNGNADLSGQLSVRVLTPSDTTDLATYGYGSGIAANEVVFVILNNVGTASSITQVYWQDGPDTSPATPAALGSFVDRVNGGGANYPNSVGTGNLPGGNSLNPDFDDTYQMDPNPPASPSGINSA
jgi:hypothetical protein